MVNIQQIKTEALTIIRSLKQNKVVMKAMLLTVEDKLSAKDKAKFAEIKNKN